MSEEETKGYDSLTSKKSTKPLDRSFNRFLIWVGFGAAVVCAGALFVYWWVQPGEVSSNQAYWGQFGDYFGGVTNPLLAFASLVALLKALNLQNKELKNSRQELKYSRQELELTREEMKTARRMQQKEMRQTREEMKLSREVSEQQKAHLERRSKIEDMIRLIEALETQLNTYLDLPLYGVGDKGPDFTIRRQLEQKSNRPELNSVIQDRGVKVHWIGDLLSDLVDAAAHLALVWGTENNEESHPAALLILLKAKVRQFVTIAHVIHNSDSKNFPKIIVEYIEHPEKIMTKAETIVKLSTSSFMFTAFP